MRVHVVVSMLVVLIATFACGNDATGLDDFADETPAIDGVVRTVVRDEFNRRSTFGWGIADVGGTWRMSQPARFSVRGGAGVITVESTRPENTMPDEGFGFNVSGVTRFKIDRVPDGGGFHTFQVYARRDDRFSDGDNWYRFRVRLYQNHQFGRHMDVRIAKNVEGVPSFITDAVRLNTTFSPNTWYWVRWEAIGSAPTRLRMRVWPAGEPEPAIWDIDLAHHEPRLDVEGKTGFRVEGPSTQTNWPVQFTIGEIHFAEVATE